eukprot:1001609-Alexandrium_andersonii.AAC.1
MSASLVGSEMCIRDSFCPRSAPAPIHARARGAGSSNLLARAPMPHRGCPVSYTHLTLPTICSV